jgi:hypothetical protein
MKKIKTGLAFIFVLTFITVYSQSGSSYSAYGIGKLQSPGTGINDVFGGAGAGIRGFNILNPVNPASYSAQDTNSFLADIGINGTEIKRSSSSASESASDFEINNITVGFPLFKWWVMSLGISPYSEVEYYLTEQSSFNIDNNNYLVDYYYQGNGGLNNIRIGSGFRVTDYFSLGFNADYVFGYNSYIYEISPSVPYGASTYEEQYLKTGDFRFTFGAQYYEKFNERWLLTAGAVYSPKTNLGGKMNQELILNTSTQYGTIEDVISSSEGTPRSLTIPETYRFGFTLENEPEGRNFKHNFTIALDYSLSNWANTNTFLNNKLKNSSSIGGGIEYVPQPKAFKGYWKRIKYRAGLNYSDTYMNVNNSPVIDKSFSVGLGLPVKYSHTTFNISYHRGVLGSSSNNLIEENYNIFRFNITIYDFWFIKPKID